jgi:hypothetical protein
MKPMITIKKTIRLTAPDRLDEDDMQTALCMPGIKPLVVLALQQVLQDHIDDAVELVGNLKTASDHGTLAHCAGGLDALRAFQSDLIQRIEESSKQP